MMIQKIKHLFKKLPYGIIAFLAQIPFPPLEKVKEIMPYFKQKEMRSYWKLHPNSKKNKARIIIYGLRTNAACNLAVFEKVFSDVFRYNGADIQNLICDNLLSSCDGAVDGEPETDKIICNACKKQRETFKKLYPNDFIYFHEFISNEEFEVIKELIAETSDDDLINLNYKGINVGKHAVDSCIKYFRYGVFNPCDQQQINILRHNVYQGMMTVKIAENLIARENPTHIFTLHGCYATWGPFSEYCRNKGLHVYIYRKSINKVGDFDFTRFGEDTNDVVAKEVWDNVKYKDLGLEQQRCLSDFLYKKKSGATLDYQLYNLGKNGAVDEELIKYLEHDPRKKFVLYSHLLWDKGFNTLGGLFEDDKEWMFETISFFIEHPESLLFVKPHPGERSFFDWSEKGVKEVILEKFGKLPENIVLIKNDCPITGFELMDRGCIGVVFNGTSGLEHNYFKKPVIVAANIHYVNAGAALKINTKDEYFNLISNPQPLYEFIENNYDHIERYAYHYYFRQQLPIPFFLNNVFLGHCIKWDALRNYRDFIENNTIMNHIAKSIIEGKSVTNLD